jgi:hypothetical protein
MRAAITSIMFVAFELSACVADPSRTDAVQIPSHAYWVDTQVNVTQGETIVLVAQGYWWDFVIRSSADGYPAGLFYAIHEFPREKDDGRYFRLMGRVFGSTAPPSKDTTDTALDPTAPDGTFVIGTHVVYTAKRNGRLYVFANDRKCFYWNNWGHLNLIVKHLP